MALFGRDDKDPKTDRPFTPPPEVKPQPAIPPVKELQTPMEPERTVRSEGGDVHAYLGKGSRVSGKLNFDGTVRVDGHVEGEISAQDTLIVGESAVVTAQISGNTVIIKGKVTGDINARTRLEIRAPGKLYGNIV